MVFSGRKTNLILAENRFEFSLSDSIVMAGTILFRKENRKWNV